MNVVAKLRKLPLAAKIGCATVVALLFGVVGYYFIGGAAGALAGGAGTIATLLGLWGTGDDGLAGPLLDAEIKRAEKDADDSRRADERAARDRAAARVVRAEVVARAASANDGDDLGRVYDRNKRPGGG